MNRCEWCAEINCVELGCAKADELQLQIESLTNKLEVLTTRCKYADVIVNEILSETSSINVAFKLAQLFKEKYGKLEKIKQMEVGE